MLKSKLWKTLAGIVATSLVAVTYVGCQGGGNTEGEPGTAAVGTQVVSDGGSGATLTISATGPIMVGERVPFTVTALDPSGAPLSFIRIACETEAGISILEPVRGGSAFASTGAAGVMSGVLGGLVPGSFLLECRGPAGFNLVDRLSLLIVGDIPEGFDGFPGAAGGNLGGGLLVENPVEDAVGVEILFETLSGTTRNGPIDTVQSADCNGDGIANDPETAFGFDNYIITINNQRDDRLFISSTTYSVASLGVSATTQAGGLVVPANTESTPLVGSFTDFVSGGKTFAGTATAVPINATVNVTFTVRGTTGGGSSFSITQTASVTFGPVNNC